MKYDGISELEKAYRVKLAFTVNGKRKFISKCFNFEKCGSKADALRKAKKYRDEMTFKYNHDLVDDAKVSLNDVLRLWDVQTVRSAETKKKHDGLVANHILSVIEGGIPFVDIDSILIQMSLNSAKNKSQGVIDRLYGVWQKIYAVAIKNRVCNRDLTVECDIPRSKKVIVHRDQNFDISLFPAVLRDINRGDDGPLICCCLKLMFYTGIRPAEALAIERYSIDFENCSISIHQSLGSDELSKDTIIPTKTEESIRTVYFPGEFADELRSHCKQKFVFTRKNGILLTTAHLNYHIRRYSTIEFRPYMLRHSAASRLLESGVSLRTLQDILGHASPQMSQRYARTFESQKQEALKKIW